MQAAAALAVAAVRAAGVAAVGTGRVARARSGEARPLPSKSCPAPHHLLLPSPRRQPPPPHSPLGYLAATATRFPMLLGPLRSRHACDDAHSQSGCPHWLSQSPETRRTRRPTAAFRRL